MPLKNKITFEHNGIATVIENNRLEVPLNQREYAWGREHVDDLLKDFTHAIQETNPSYFLGTIVLTADEDGHSRIVCDGQQRLATTTILIAGIRDFFYKRGEKERAESIEQQFLFRIDRRSTKTVPKLVLNVDDREFFRNRILSRPDSKARNIDAPLDSHKKLILAAELVATHIKQLVTPWPEDRKANLLLAWLDFLQDDAQIIILKVPDDLDAFVMFETLNDRGLDTSKADLIKNHLFKMTPKSMEEAQQKWARMRGVLESLSIPDITVTYLRHLLITEYGPTRDRDVLARVKSDISNEIRAIEFLDKLATSADDYVAMLTPSHAKWNGYGESTRAHLRTIHQILRVEQIRPLMFAVAKYFDVIEGKKAFRMFVNWSVRFLIHGGRGGLLDRNYALASQKIGNKTITTAKELRLELEDIIPTDGEFEASFAVARVAQSQLARYYLRAVELHVKQDPEPETVPNEEQEQVNLEHVLPEQPWPHWGHITPEMAAAYYKRIGNLVLLKVSQNQLAGNLSFADKKVILAQSGYTLTSEVALEHDWNVPEIEARQARLASRAVKTWPIKP